MDRQHSLLVEWLWSEGLLKQNNIEYWSHVLWRRLQHKYPNSHFHVRGLEAIHSGIESCLLRLTYGGREAKDIPSFRKTWLKSNIVF